MRKVTEEMACENERRNIGKSLTEKYLGYIILQKGFEESITSTIKKSEKANAKMCW